MAEYKRESHRVLENLVDRLKVTARENLTEILENLTGYRVLSTEYCSLGGDRVANLQIENITGYCSWLSTRENLTEYRVLSTARENLTEILENLTGYRVLSTEYCSLGGDRVANLQIENITGYCSWLSTRENLTGYRVLSTEYCSWLSTRENLTEILENLTGYRVLSTEYCSLGGDRVANLQIENITGYCSWLSTRENL